MALAHYIKSNRKFADEIQNKSHKSVSEKVRAILQLSSKDQFGVSRFLGLWRHPVFQDLCNSLCATGVGRELFSIGVFSNLKESRVFEVCIIVYLPTILTVSQILVQTLYSLLLHYHVTPPPYLSPSNRDSGAQLTGRRFLL